MTREDGQGEGGYQKTVFVDTSLDTHLATIISDSDTVSDLKRKIMLEHRQCFPAIGDISIHCLKVKRRGNYYHLADSMLVKSAFGASQKNWFLSVDASRLQQCDSIQHNPGDQLALPWVNDSRSIDTHDSQADIPSKLSLIRGSPSKHPKIAPFVNKNVPSVDHFTSKDTCKKVSKSIEEEKSSHDEHCRNLEPDLEQQLDSKVEEKVNSVNKEKKSKKRIRDVHNEDASVKKRRKTHRTEGDIKGSGEDRVLADDIGKVKDNGTGVNDENSIEDKSKSGDAALDVVVTKSMDYEHTRTILVSQKKPKRTKKGKSSAHDQVAIVVPSSVTDIREEIHPLKNIEASEVIPEVAMVVEKNIQHEAPFQSSQKEKGNELVQEANIVNEVPSLSMKGVTAEEELPVKHADDLVGMSLTDPTPVFDERLIDEQKKDKANIISDEKNEVSKKTSIDDSLVYNNKGDDLIVKGVKNAEPTESHKSRVHKEKSRKEIKETARSRTKKIDAGKSASRKDEIVKHSSNDAATGTNEETLLPPEIKEKITPIDALHVDRGRNDENLNNDAEISKTETVASQLNAEIPENQNENMGDTKKTKKKKIRKTKKSTARKEGENGDLLDKIADISQEDVITDGDKIKSKDAQISDEGLVKEAKKNHISTTTAYSEMPSRLELEPEKSKIPEETTENVTVSQVPKGNDVISDVGIPKERAREIDFMEYFSPSQQPNKIAAHDGWTDSELSVREKKVKKKSQQDSRKDNVIRSPSKNENKKELSSKKIPKVFADGVGVKDRNDSNNAKVKTQKKTTKIDAPKTSKPALINKPQPSSKSGSISESFGRSFGSQKITNQQPTMGRSQVKNLKKSVPSVKSLLNTPRTIFGDNSDDSSANDNATLNSDSSTRTPSAKSLSSGESDSSIDSRRVKRKETAGKNNINSQSRLKNISMADLLRSSSRFKKARVAASQQLNTESEPVDFVPESQLIS